MKLPNILYNVHNMDNLLWRMFRYFRQPLYLFNTFYINDFPISDTCIVRFFNLTNYLLQLLSRTISWFHALWKNSDTLRGRKKFRYHCTNYLLQGEFECWQSTEQALSSFTSKIDAFAVKVRLRTSDRTAKILGKMYDTSGIETASSRGKGSAAEDT